MGRNPDYYGDTAYEVWRSGGNPDRLDRQRVIDHAFDGRSPEEAAAYEMRRWQHQREAREMQNAEEQRYHQCQECGNDIDTSQGGHVCGVEQLPPDENLF